MHDARRSPTPVLHDDGRAVVRSGTGSSALVDGRAAGEQAAATALAHLAGEGPALVLVFASVTYDLAELLAGVRSVTGTTPLVGATSAGQLVTGTYVPVGEGVVVAVMTGGDYRLGVACVEGMRADIESTGSEVARAARAAAAPEPGSHSVLLLFTDGLAGDQQALVRGVYRVAGAAVPVVGAAAADDRRVLETSVFHDGRVVSDAAVGIWISSPTPISVGCAHGWRPTSESVLVTQATGATINELNGRPAGLVYEALLGEQAVRLREEPFASVALTHPLGMLQPDGTLAVRSLLRVADDQSITAFAPVPEAVAVHVMSGTAEDLVSTAGDVVARTVSAAARPGLLLAFSCAARRHALGADVALEAERIQQAAGDVPTIGFYTFGEFARIRGVMGFHNATVTAVAL